MTLAQFERENLVGDRVGATDQVWFPRWLRRHWLSFRNAFVDALSVNLKNGASAWQRWQAVRAIECYRDLFLQRFELA